MSARWPWSTRAGRSGLVDSPVSDAEDHRSWSAADRYWTMMLRVGVLGALAHAGFLVLFLAVHIPLLVAVNVGSLLCYGVILWATRRRKSMWVITLTATELLTHAVAAAWVLGWDSNFQYYVLLVLPVALQAEGTRIRKVAGAVVVTAAFLGMTAWLGGAGPTVDVDPHLVVALRLMNTTVYLTMLCYLSFVYFRTVEDAEARLRRLAERDAMTGLLNRSSFLARAGRTLPADDTADAPAWVVFVDIDHFKAINDTYGHAAGDAAIRHVSERISRTVRHRDLVARWGGEEFLVLLAEADESTALDVAERLRTSVTDASAAEPHLRGLTVTVGVARHAVSAGLDATISRADAALYRGKEAGRDRVEVAAAIS